MASYPYAIFLLLIGAAFSSLISLLICLLFHHNRDRINPKVTKTTNENTVENQSVILGLDEHSQNALGEFAKPGRLRQMRTESIKRLLDRHGCSDKNEDVNRELKEKFYNTWPEQAGLICRGEYYQLKQWQNDELNQWRNEHQNSEENPNCNNDGNTTATTNYCHTVLLFLFLLFLILSAIAYALCKQNPHCNGSKCSEPKIRYTERLIKGSKFKYKTTDLEDKNKAIQEAKGILAKYEDDLKIISIRTFTDPIGGSCFNQDLAQRRAESIKEIALEVLEKENRDLGDLDEVTTSEGGPGTTENDQDTWKRCLKIHQETQNPPSGKRPLRLFKPNDKTLKNCDQQKVEAFKQAGYENYEPNIATDSKNFKALEECLKPMRLVEFVLEGTKKQPTLPQAQN